MTSPPAHSPADGPSGRAPHGRSGGPSKPPGGIRVRTVVLAGAVAALFGYLVFSVVRGQIGSLPAPSVTAAAIIAVVAVAQFFVARRISRGVKGVGRTPLDPLWAYRMLQIAQASAVTGAVVAGWFLGLVIVLFPDVDASSVRGAALAAGAVSASGVLLTVAGLTVQSAARLDPPDPDESGQHS